MGFNKKVLSKAVSELGKAKAPAKPRDITVDPKGYWNPANQGQPVRVPGNGDPKGVNITMGSDPETGQPVPYPVWAQPNVGSGSMMQPNQDYNFPGASYVDETPMAKKGGTLQSKKYSKSMSATNKLFTKNKLFQNKKSKIFDPNAEFKTGGSKLGTINLNPNPLSHYELNYGFNLPTKENGGEADYEDLELTDEEIQAYKDGGYVVEELPKAQNGLASSPEEWGKEIKTIERQIGNPKKWTLEGYNLLQNKLNDYKNWRENTPEGQAVIDSHNVAGEYNVPVPEHLSGIPYNTTGPRNKVEPEAIPVGDPWSPDYDLRRFTAEDPMGFEAFSHGKGHATDQYKLPNHPTFSDHTNWADGSVSHGSLYSNTENPGGEWVQKQDGSWNFNTSHVNRSNMSDEDLKWYFENVEPGNTLNNNPIKKQGGFVQHELVKAQTGKEKQDTDISLDDYLKLYENSLALEKGITSMPNYRLENTDTNVDDYLKNLEVARNSWNEYDAVQIKNRKQIQDRLNDKKSPPIEKYRIAFEKILKEKLQPREIQDYYTVVSPNNFYQRDITNGFVNKEFTPAYYDSRIKPSSRNVYQGYRPRPDGTEEVFDQIELYKYDPVEVKKQALLKYADSEEAFQNILNNSTGNAVTSLKSNQIIQETPPNKVASEQITIPVQNAVQKTMRVPVQGVEDYWIKDPVLGNIKRQRPVTTYKEVPWTDESASSQNYNINTGTSNTNVSQDNKKHLTAATIPEPFRQGGELVKAQKGKTVKPYYTSDPKEYAYRNKMYSDSLSLYNDINLRENTRENVIKEGLKFMHDTHKHSGNYMNVITPGVKNFSALVDSNRSLNDLNTINKKIKPIGRGQMSAVDKNGNIIYDKNKTPHMVEYPVYKKPVQRVNYIQSLQSIDKKPVKPVQPAKPIEEVTPLKHMSFPQVARPEQEIIPAAPYKKPVRYSGPRHGTWSDGSKGQFPQGLNTSDWERKTKEYQQKQRGAQPIVTRKQGGTLESYQKKGQVQPKVTVKEKPYNFYTSPLGQIVGQGLAIQKKQALDRYNNDQNSKSNAGWSSEKSATPNKKKPVQPTVQQKTAQKLFDEKFKVTGKDAYTKVKDKIVTSQKDYIASGKKNGYAINQKDLDDIETFIWKANGVGQIGEADTLQATPTQSNSNRAWEYITNPFTAAEYAISGGGAENMPHNINEMRMAGIDPGVVQGRNLVGNTLNSTLNLFDAGDKVVRNIGEGNYGSAFLEGLRFIPGSGLLDDAVRLGVKPAIKTIAKSIGKKLPGSPNAGIQQAGIFNSIENVNKNITQHSDIPYNVKVTPEQQKLLDLYTLENSAFHIDPVRIKELDDIINLQSGNSFPIVRHFSDLPTLKNGLKEKELLESGMLTSNRPLSFSSFKGSPEFGKHRMLLNKPENQSYLKTSDNAFLDEHEIVLPSNLQYKVIKNNPNTFGGIDYHVEIINGQPVMSKQLSGSPNALFSSTEKAGITGNKNLSGVQNVYVPKSTIENPTAKALEEHLEMTSRTGKPEPIDRSIKGRLTNFIKSSIAPLDEGFIMPIRYNSSIKKAMKYINEQKEYFKIPEVRAKLIEYGVDPDELQKINFQIGNTGSSAYGNRIKFDPREMKQIQKLGVMLDERTIMAHELGHSLGFNAEKTNNVFLPNKTIKDLPINKELYQEVIKNKYDYASPAHQLEYFTERINKAIPESYAHLREMKQNMINTGIIKRLDEPVTEEQLIEFFSHNYKTGKDRVSTFVNKTDPKLIKFLSKELSNARILVPTIGTGVLGAGALQQEKDGGATESWEDDLTDDEINALEAAGFIVEDVNSYQVGGGVSDTWEKVTGTSWDTAKQKGYTSGSYNDNINLLKQLNEGKFNSINKTIQPVINEKKVIKVPAEINTQIKTAKSFNEAFGIARNTMGPNQIFEYNGRKYGTNQAGETFKPSEEVLKASGLNSTKVKERLNKQNTDLNSPYLNKKTVKLQPDEYISWDKVKTKNIEINKNDNAQKIIDYNKNRNFTKNYVIVDKKKGLMHIYAPGNSKPLFSSAVDLGESRSDAQTTTKVKDTNGDGIIDKKEAQIGKADFSKGNKSTGAGKYYISNIDAKGYEGLPLFNMMSEAQYDAYLKTGKIDNVATSFHKGYVADDVNRVSNGCIRCNKTTLDNLTKYLKNSSEVYILPEDDNNNFVYENGKLNFQAKHKTNLYTYKNNGNIYKKENNVWYVAPKVGSTFKQITDPVRVKSLNTGATSAGYNFYEDSHKIVQQGQGVNKSTNTLNYIPIKTTLDEATFKKNNYKDSTTDNEKLIDNSKLLNVKTYVDALATNKQKIMKATKINGDVYNELAKMSFGILGTESNYADIHTPAGNFGRAVKKYFYPKSSSSPDYYSKYYTYGVTDNSNSVGLTQIRWSYLNASEKAALKELGITSNKDFMDPKKAAIGTTAILAIRYNEQLNNTQKQDMWKYLPTKWNTRDNYASRVKNNSRYMSIAQQNKNK
jgi:hypothetical protein